MEEVKKEEEIKKKLVETVKEIKKPLRFSCNVFYDKQEFKKGQEWTGLVPEDLKPYLE